MALGLDNDVEVTVVLGRYIFVHFGEAICGDNGGYGKYVMDGILNLIGISIILYCVSIILNCISLFVDIQYRLLIK